ncbi:MAG TPA: DUF393 domain-containing protein [Marmoricola sp.]|jgi:predicted DCC family thiol-disulfide oxidoreductase YuxK|nr:DUF393 domain-containing protein [Marmoricola sp.]
MSGRLVYDADCGFCTRSATWLARGTGNDPVPWHTVDIGRAGITQAVADANAGWLVGDRVTVVGGAAIAEAMRARGGWTAPLGRVMLLPGVRLLVRLVYPVIARNRHRLPGGTAACRFDPH